MIMAVVDGQVQSEILSRRSAFSGQPYILGIPHYRAHKWCINDPFTWGGGGATLQMLTAG